jgi:aminoglycoside 2'-N-acetyltransferase I
VATILTASTDEAPDRMLRLTRQMLDEAFAGDFSDDDWRNCLGGLHCWLMESDAVVAHGALVARRLWCGEHVVLTGYAEAVAVAAERRGQGIGTRLMRRLGELIRERYALGALSTGAYAFYEKLGWERWRGPTYVATDRGPERTPDDDDGVMILRTPRTPEINCWGPIICDWRDGDVW